MWEGADIKDVLSLHDVNEWAYYACNVIIIYTPSVFEYEVEQEAANGKDDA